MVAPPHLVHQNALNERTAKGDFVGSYTENMHPGEMRTANKRRRLRRGAPEDVGHTPSQQPPAAVATFDGASAVVIGDIHPFRRHHQRRLANSAAVGLGMTALILAITLLGLGWWYRRHESGRSGLGRDPLARNCPPPQSMTSPRAEQSRSRTSKLSPIPESPSSPRTDADGSEGGDRRRRGGPRSQSVYPQNSVPPQAHLTPSGGSNFKDMYRLGKDLGKGAFAVVKEGSNKTTGEEFAIKIVTKSKLTEEDAAALKDEIDILMDLRHPNIVLLYQVFDERKYFYLVMEVVRGGELFDRIVAKSYYNEKEARDVCRILFGTLAYCHGKNVAHRDLKPENLLLMSMDNDSDIKLADFGFAKRVISDACLTTQCGTPAYVAPEVLEGVKYGTKSDMWSIGVITYILLGGYPPFLDQNQHELFCKIRSGEFEFHQEYWSQISDDAMDLISALLAVDPGRRLSAEQALRSPWFTDSSDDALSARDLGRNLEEFKKFNAIRKFKAAVTAVIATNKMKYFGQGGKNKTLTRKLTADEIEEMRESFNMFDTDGGGTISLEELKWVMQKMGQRLSERELVDMIAIVDEDGNGEIDFEEFQVMMQSAVGDTDRNKELIDAFEVFDTDGDGSTSRDELRRLLQKFGQNLNDDELDAVMAEVDADGDGEISFEEFCHVMK